MDGLKEMPYMGFDIYCDVSLSWVVWLVFQPRQIWSEMGMPRGRCMAYLGQHQCPTLYMIFNGFTILKPICIMF